MIREAKEKYEIDLTKEVLVDRGKETLKEKYKQINRKKVQKGRQK